jgi:hypothetical protein
LRGEVLYDDEEPGTTLATTSRDGA